MLGGLEERVRWDSGQRGSAPPPSGDQVADALFACRRHQGENESTV